MKVKATIAGCFTTYTLFLAAIVSQTAATQTCSQDMYYDPQTDTCHPCNEICHLSDDVCKRLCPEMCSKDTYYDPKVEACQPCQEVCPSSDDRCSKLCPDMVMPPTMSTSATTTTSLIPTSGGEMANTTTWTMFTGSTPTWHTWIIIALTATSMALVSSLIVFIMWYCGCIKTPVGLLGCQQWCCSPEQGRAHENTKSPIQESRLVMSPPENSAAECSKPRFDEVDDLDGRQNVLPDDHSARPTGYIYSNEGYSVLV